MSAETDLPLDRARTLFGLAGAPAPTPLAGDIGARRYFRQATASGASVVLVLYPEPQTDAQANWVAIGTALAAAGVRVPQLHADSPALGAALIEDLGNHDLAMDLAEAPIEDRTRLLDEAEDLLLALRSIARDVAARNPAFDTAFFERELEHTKHWALEKGGRELLDAQRAESWTEGAAALARTACDPAVTGDAVATHRDFHANNLMRAPDGRLAAIDFQDLRLGPPDYDPVSLRFERAAEGIPCDAEAYAEAVLLQRAWKVLGTFEKMMLLGRPFYRPHREAAVRVLKRHTAPEGPFAPLLAFL